MRYVTFLILSLFAWSAHSSEGLSIHNVNCFAWTTPWYKTQDIVDNGGIMTAWVVEYLEKELHVQRADFLVHAAAKACLEHPEDKIVKQVKAAYDLTR